MLRTFQMTIVFKEESKGKLTKNIGSHIKAQTSCSNQNNEDKGADMFPTNFKRGSKGKSTKNIDSHLKTQHPALTRIVKIQ